jgi:hypothetical protein
LDVSGNTRIDGVLDMSNHLIVDVSGIWFNNGTNLNSYYIGYRFVEQIIYTSDASFNKSNYPFLSAIRVRCQGGGGGGGGTDSCNVGESASAGAGGGGGYAESFILVSDISNINNIIVGEGGTAGLGGAGGGANPGTNGTIGGDSSFGLGTSYQVVAKGGDRGDRGFESNDFRCVSASSNTTGNIGQIVRDGEGTQIGFRAGGVNDGTSSVRAYSSRGGNSLFGVGAVAREVYGDEGAGDGQSPQGYGSGGGGGVCCNNSQPQDISGGNGSNGTQGLVILDLFTR